MKNKQMLRPFRKDHHLTSHPNQRPVISWTLPISPNLDNSSSPKSHTGLPFHPHPGPHHLSHGPPLHHVHHALSTLSLPTVCGEDPAPIPPGGISPPNFCYAPMSLSLLQIVQIPDLTNAFLRDLSLFFILYFLPHFIAGTP